LEGIIMKIQVLGSGCPTCKKLFELTQQAVKELSIKDEVEYITDVQKIVEMGVMSSPVLAIDGKPVLVGVLPDLEKIKRVLVKRGDDSEISSPGCNCGSDW
jgi:small redox-active disulfide protein 2